MATVAVTVGVRSGSSVVLSTAATVAVSEAAVVAPAAITMVASEPTVQAPATAVTVTVVAESDGRDSFAVTVATPPLSETLSGATAKVTPGGPSSSVVVTSTSTLSRPL